jgi:hypothetical protein
MQRYYNRFYCSLLTSLLHVSVERPSSSSTIYYNNVAYMETPSPWSHTRNRMQTTNLKGIFLSTQCVLYSMELVSPLFHKDSSHYNPVWLLRSWLPSPSLDIVPSDDWFRPDWVVFMSVYRSSLQGQYFSLLCGVQTGYEASSVFLFTVPKPLSPQVKRPGREADYSLPSSADDKIGGNIFPPFIRSSWHRA